MLRINQGLLLLFFACLVAAYQTGANENLLVSIIIPLFGTLGIGIGLLIGTDSVWVVVMSILAGIFLGTLSSLSGTYFKGDILDREVKSGTTVIYEALFLMVLSGLLLPISFKF